MIKLASAISARWLSRSATASLHPIVLLLMVGLSQTVLPNTIRVPANQPTIQAAIDAASPGDTVLVSPGVYTENLNFKDKRLVVASHFLATGDTAFISQTIIDGNRSGPVVTFQGFEPAGAALVGFSIRNGLGSGDFPNSRGGGIHIAVVAQPLIRYCYIFGNETSGTSNRGGGIYASSQTAVISNCRIYSNTSENGAGISIGNGALGAVVDSCSIFSNTGSGIQISYSEAVRVSRTKIYGNSDAGIRNALSNQTSIIHCTISGNGSAGFKHEFSPSQGLDTLFILNSIIHANAQSYDVDNDTTLFASYSIIESGSGKLWFGQGGKDVDPQFANALYELSSTSPAIDAGDPNSPLDPDNTIADMGTHFYQQPTAIEERDEPRPTGFALQQNYPNPFNPSTVISFELPVRSIGQLAIYATTGQLVRTLISGEYAAGLHHVAWDGRDDKGKRVASGTYFYQISAGVFQSTKHMLFLK